MQIYEVAAGCSNRDVYIFQQQQLWQPGRLLATQAPHAHWSSESAYCFPALPSTELYADLECET